jgi:hypothetical protein
MWLEYFVAHAEAKLWFLLRLVRKNLLYSRGSCQFSEAQIRRACYEAYMLGPRSKASQDSQSAWGPFRPVSVPSSTSQWTHPLCSQTSSAPFFPCSLSWKYKMEDTKRGPSRLWLQAINRGGNSCIEVLAVISTQFTTNIHSCDESAQIPLSPGGRKESSRRNQEQLQHCNQKAEGDICWRFTETTATL